MEHRARSQESESRIQEKSNPNRVSSNYLLQITYACRVSMLRWSWARRPRSKIPLGPPLEKGEDSCLPVRNPIESPPFVKGGWGDFVYGHGFCLNTGIVICIASYGGATLSGWLMDQSSPSVVRAALQALRDMNSWMVFGRRPANQWQQWINKRNKPS
jgi:hypothetical protein